MNHDRIWIEAYQVSGHYRSPPESYESQLTATEQAELAVLREMVEGFRIASNPNRRWSIVTRIDPQQSDEFTEINAVDQLLERFVPFLQPTSWGYQLLKIVSLFFGDKPFSLPQIYAAGERILQQLHPHNTVIRSNIRYELQRLRDQGLVKNIGVGVWQASFKRTR